MLSQAVADLGGQGTMPTILQPLITKKNFKFNTSTSTKIRHFEIKKFSANGHCPIPDPPQWGENTPPTLHPLALWRLDSVLSALDHPPQIHDFLDPPMCMKLTI